MSLRQPLSRIWSFGRPPMRLDTFRASSSSWGSSKLRSNVSTRQVLVFSSQDKVREPGPNSSAAAELSTLASIGPQRLGSNITTRNAASGNVAFKENAAPDVHLAPKPQRVPPPPVDKPRPGDGFFQSRPPSRRDSHGLPLRDRLQIARRRRPPFQDRSGATTTSAASPSSSPSSFDLIVANRLANSPPAPPPTKETDTFSPLVKAIFDLLDQAPPVQQPEKSAFEADNAAATAAATNAALQAHQTYYHRQRHKYRIYQQAFNTGDPRFDALGRTLCRILRHQATSLSLDVRSNGYVKVGDILGLGIRTHAGIPMNEHSVEEILQVVERDPKQRYSTMIEDGELFVRANQGHSMKVVASDQLLTEITAAEEVAVCVHGTFRCFLPSIMRTGLNRMSRNHIHFAIGLPNEEGVISGMMDSVEVLIYLDVAKALADGMKLYISDNRVLLTEGFAGIVPVDYFEKVVEWPSFNVIA